MNNVLVVGRGGREHALAWKLQQSPKVKKVYVAPGSKGMENVATIVNIDELDFESLAAFAKSENIVFTVVGPEAPLAKGIVDYFSKEGLAIFGPTAAAAEIEASKSFSKALMEKYHIPTAASKIFTNCDEACEYVKTLPTPIVLKADGLAAGKGVAIVNSVQDAIETLKDMMENEKYGIASRKVVIEEFLEGEEYTFMAFVKGENVYPMELSRDYQKAYDGDKGPITGGMGAYSPTTKISDEEIVEAKEVLNKTAKALAKEGRPFAGFLYGGFISGAKVIEFNSRFGDPEAEVLLLRLESDLFEVIELLLKGEAPTLKWSSDVAVGVVLASTGYPESPKTGYPISGLDDLKPDTLVFHCGTDYKDGTYITNGGRVLMVVRMAKTLAQARDEVYEEIDKIKCEELFWRTDVLADA